MANTATLVVKVISDVKDAQKGLGDVQSKASGMHAKLGTAAKVAGGVLAGIGVAAIGAGKAAAEDAQAQAILAKAMRNAAGASDDQIASTEDWISKQAMATGVADDQMRPALGNLVRATGDVTKSQDAMGVALDVAAATGLDVESVSKAMAKGYAGNTSALGKLVPGIDKATLASGDMTKVMAELQRKTGGSAAAAADTAAGKFARFKLGMDETKEAMGSALLPIMEKLSGVMLTIANFAQQHGTLFAVLAGVIGIVAAAIVIMNVALTISTILEGAFGEAAAAAWMAALGPIALVIAAIVAVVAIVVLLWNKFPPFKAAVIAVWNAIKTAAVATWNFIKAAAAVVFAALRAYVMVWVVVFTVAFNVIRTVASAVGTAIRAVWNAVFSWFRSTVASVKSAITTAFNTVRSVVGTVASGVQSAWNTVFGALTRAASGVASALSGPFNAVKGVIDGVIGAVQTLIGWLGKIKVPKISLPHIPGLSASAATTASGTRATLGRAGTTSVATRAGQVSAGPTFIIQAIDPETSARVINRILERHTQRQGQTGVIRTV